MVLRNPAPLVMERPKIVAGPRIPTIAGTRKQCRRTRKVLCNPAPLVMELSKIGAGLRKPTIASTRIERRRTRKVLCNAPTLGMEHPKIGAGQRIPTIAGSRKQCRRLRMVAAIIGFLSLLGELFKRRCCVLRSRGGRHTERQPKHQQARHQGRLEHAHRLTPPTSAVTIKQLAERGALG